MFFFSSRILLFFFFFFQAEDGIRDFCLSRGLGDVYKRQYRSKSPERGDIVIFRYPDNEEELYVKRVIGLPGETVDIRDGYIYIDGADTPLDEDYLKEDWTVATGNYHFEVPEDSYLMLGDNRNDSWDARYWTNPYVREDKILGKAAVIYWPVHDIGKLE